MNIKLAKKLRCPAPKRMIVSRDIADKFSKNHPPYEILRNASIMLGVSRKMLAEEMGMSPEVLHKLESGKLRMSPSFMLKIFMFGLDFWADTIYWRVSNGEPLNTDDNDVAASTPDDE